MIFYLSVVLDRKAHLCNDLLYQNKELFSNGRDQAGAFTRKLPQRLRISSSAQRLIAGLLKSTYSKTMSVYFGSSVVNRPNKKAPEWERKYLKKPMKKA